MTQMGALHSWLVPGGRHWVGKHYNKISTGKKSVVAFFNPSDSHPWTTLIWTRQSTDAERKLTTMWTRILASNISWTSFLVQSFRVQKAFVLKWLKKEKELPQSSFFSSVNFLTWVEIFVVSFFEERKTSNRSDGYANNTRNLLFRLSQIVVENSSIGKKEVCCYMCLLGGVR